MGTQKDRTTPRTQVSLIARYRSPTAFDYVREECFDLSTGGMFIKSDAPAPTGTLLKLDCEVDGGASTIRGVARVVWLRESEVDEQPSGMGVKFVKLDAGARETIHDLLQRIATDGSGSVSTTHSSLPHPPPSVTPPALAASSEATASQQPTAASSVVSPAEDSDVHEATVTGHASAHGLRERLRLVQEAHDVHLGDEHATHSHDAAPTSAQAGASQPPVAEPTSESSAEAEAASSDGRESVAAVDTALGVLRAASSSPPANDVNPQHAATGTPSAPKSGGPSPAASAPTPGFNWRPAAYAAAVAMGATLVYVMTQPAPEGPIMPQPAAVQSRAPEPLATAVPEPPAEVIPAPELPAKVIAAPEPSAELTAAPPSVALPVPGPMPAEPALPPEPEAVAVAVATKAKVHAKEAAPAPRPTPSSPVAAATATVAPAPVAKPSAPAPRAVTPAAEPVPPAAVAVTKAEPKPEPPEAPPAAAAVPATPKQTPLQAALGCLATGDNACVLKALEGKAKGPRELELLIETYRTTGASAKATQLMQQYVNTYPSEKRSGPYRQVLDRQRSTPPPP